MFEFLRKQTKRTSYQFPNVHAKLNNGYFLKRFAKKTLAKKLPRAMRAKKRLLKENCEKEWNIHIKANGIPMNAYRMVRIRPVLVFGAMLP